MPYYGWGGGFSKPRSVADRRRDADKHIKQLRKKGIPIAPIILDGRQKIVTTFWGNAWCDNIEAYQDYAYRLDRGRSYVRHNQVIDLHIAVGHIRAQVSGSAIYQTDIRIDPLPPARWTPLVARCTGQIGSMVELLQGRLSKEVMAVFCDQQTGLFPAPREIHFSCSCPDSASLCKHVAAVLYGVGTRLDEAPELLFRLRNVDESALLISAGALGALPGQESAFDDEDLSDLFGIEIDTAPLALPPPPPPPPAPAAPQPLTNPGLPLHDAVLLAWIAALLGITRWDQVPTFCQESRPWLSSLLPRWEAGLPETALLQVLSPALRLDALAAWRGHIGSTSRRYTPTNRLHRGMEAAAASLPLAPLQLRDGRVTLDDAAAVVTLLPLLQASEAPALLRQATPQQIAGIAAAGGTYVVQLQGSRAEDAALFFHDAIALDFEDIDHVHAGTGDRRVEWVDWVDWLPGWEQWPGLSAVLMLESHGQRWYGLSNGRPRLVRRLVGCAPPADDRVALLLPPISEPLEPFLSLTQGLFRQARKTAPRNRLQWRKQAREDLGVLMELLGQT